jgi:hypothetical protein
MEIVDNTRPPKKEGEWEEMQKDDLINLKSWKRHWWTYPWFERNMKILQTVGSTGIGL